MLWRRFLRTPLSAVMVAVLLANAFVAHAVRSAEADAKPADDKDKSAAVAKAVAELGSNDFDTREKASAKLAACETSALPELKAAFEASKDPEVLNRLEAIIKKMEAQLIMDNVTAGMTTLPSGLKYKVLKEGTGAQPAKTDVVVCHYTGKFMDGTVFDSSYQRGESASFPVRGVIAGWTEALQMMKVGSKWQLVIPPNLAYGKEGAGGVIPPNSTLVFEVELLSIAGQGK